MSEFDEEVKLPIKLEFVGKDDVESDIREVGKIIDETISKLKNAPDNSWDKALPNLKELKALQGEIKKVFDDSERIRDNLSAKSERLTSTIKNLKSAYASMYAPGADPFNTETANKQLDEQRELVKRLGDDYTKSTQEASKGLDDIWNHYNKIIDKINSILDVIDVITAKTKNTTDVASEGSATVNSGMRSTKKEAEELTAVITNLSGAYGKLISTGGKSSAGENEIRVLEEKTRKLDEIRQKYAEAGNDLQENLSKYYPSITDIEEPFQKLLDMQKQEEKALEKSYELQILKAQAADGNAEAIKRMSLVEQANISKQIADLNRQKAAIKEGTAQYYYRLRSVKMLSYTLSSLDKTLSGFGKKALATSETLLKNYLKLTNVFSLFGDQIKNIVSHLGTMNSHLREAHSTSKGIRTTANHIKNEQNGINSSLKTMLNNILKYGLGIRSVYMLCRKLRKALSEGMENLATQWSEVNTQMSSVVTSLFQMKNAIAAAVQPILSVLAPALERVAQIVADIAYKVASFIAALTGTTQYVYKAKRAQQDYAGTSKKAADSTDDQAEAADDAADAMDDETEASEELRKELSKLDKLNVLTTDDSKDKDKNTKDKKQKDKKLKDLEAELGEGVQDMFEKVPIDAAMAEWAQKLKDLMEKLFKPLKGAWDTEGQFVMDAWKKALGAVWDLIKNIGRDFMTVWLQAKTQDIFENLLHVIGDIGLIVANLATNFQEAWNFAGNGRVILESIRDIILIISQGLRDAADYTVAWSANLTFIPLLTQIRQTLASQIEPAVQNIVNLLVWVYEHIFLEFLKHFIEVTAPKIVAMIGNIATAIGNISTNLLHALQDGRMGELIVDSIENIIDVIADTLLDITDYTKDWAKALDFKPLVKAIFNFIQGSQGSIRKICNLLKDVYKNVLLPMAKHIIEKSLPKALEIAGKIVKTIGNIADNLDKAFKKGDSGKKIAESAEKIFDRIGKLIDNIATATEKWSKTVDFGPLVEAIAGFFEKCEKPVDSICKLLETLYTTVILPMATYLIEKVLPKVIDWTGDIVEIIGNISDNLNDAITNSDSFQRILDSVHKIGGKIGDTIDKIITKTKEWSKNIDFEPLLESIAGWLESMEKPMDFLCSTFSSFYENVLLPFWSYIVEEGLPKLFNKLKEINNELDGKVDWDELKGKVDELFKSFEDFLEKGWDTFLELLGKLGTAIGDFVDSEDFDKIVDKLIEWMDNADPDDMANGLETLVGAFIGLKASIGAFSAITKGWSMLQTILNYFAQKKMASTLSSNSSQIATLSGDLDKLKDKVKELGGEATTTAAAIGGTSGTGAAAGGTGAAAGGGMVGSLGATVAVAALVIAAIANLMFAYGGLEGVLDRIVKLLDQLKQAFIDSAESTGLTDSLNDLKKSFDDLKQSVKDLIDAIFGEGASEAIIPALKELDKTLLEIKGFNKIIDNFTKLFDTIDSTIVKITDFITVITMSLDAFATKLRGQVLVIKGTLTGDDESVVEGFKLMKEGTQKEIDATEKAVTATVKSTGNELDKFFKERLPWYSLATWITGKDIRDVADDMNTEIDKKFKSISKSTEDTFGKDIPNSATNMKSQFETPVLTSFDNVKNAAESDSIVIRGQFDQLFKTDLPSDASNVQSQFSTPIITEFDTLKDTAETDSAAISAAVDKSFNTDLSTTADNSKTGFFEKIRQAFKSLQFDLIGDPIVYDIRDGIIEGFNEWITQTSTDVPLWASNIAKEFTTLSTDITTALQDLPANVKKKFDEVKKGAEDKCKELLKVVKDKFDDIKKAADDKLKSDTLKKNGEQVIKGLNTGMKSELSKSKSTASKGCNDIKKEFRNNLKSNSLKSIGNNLIAGLQSGMMSRLQSALQAVTSICNKIVAAAKRAFSVSSPSKVFMKIGNYLIDGLIVGVEGEENELNNTFESLVPSSELMDSFYNSFMEMMTKLTTNVTSLVNQMINTIQGAISNLTHMLRVSSLNKISNMMNNLDSMPDYSSPVASGKALPSNKEFVANVNVSVDLSKLPELMKSAFIDAIKETANLQTNDEAIIVNIDGKTIFQAVRSENAKYKKQTGVSAFA